MPYTNRTGSEEKIPGDHGHCVSINSYRHFKSAAYICTFFISDTPYNFTFGGSSAILLY